MDFDVCISSTNGRGSCSNARSQNFSDKVEVFADSMECGHPDMGVNQMHKFLVFVFANMGLIEIVLDSSKFIGKPAIFSVSGTKRKPASPVEEQPVYIRVSHYLWIGGMGRPPQWEGGIIGRGSSGSQVSQVGKSSGSSSSSSISSG